MKHFKNNGKLKLYQATKCETEEHKKIDEVAKNLIPIGHELTEMSQEIIGMIQKIYVFNKYLTAEQIMLCRMIADKITINKLTRLQAFRIARLPKEK